MWKTQLLLSSLVITAITEEILKFDGVIPQQEQQSARHGRPLDESKRISERIKLIVLYEKVARTNFLNVSLNAEAVKAIRDA